MAKSKVFHYVIWEYFMVQKKIIDSLFFINIWGHIIPILSSWAKHLCYPMCVENVWKIFKPPFILLKWNIQHFCTNICQLGLTQVLMPRLALILLQSPSNNPGGYSVICRIYCTEQRTLRLGVQVLFSRVFLWILFYPNFWAQSHTMYNMP